ncbi:HGxxPAAW family protein [Streptomyces sp. NPDC002073]|uniref:HGxxPAAW family protein n=1 Tax=Streptomyces sp. NBC_00239 TaxID=2903640 RepID=UPI002E280687|nr:HGxxPAAW family protein [Streptomyces sp. NBC_00239]
MSAHGNVDLGHTVAGWTGTALGTLAAAIAGVSLCFAWTAGLWIGGALALLALLATWGLHLAGWGKPGGPRASSDWPWRVKDSGAGAGHPQCIGCRTAGRSAGAAAVALEPAGRPDDDGVRAVGTGS